MPQEKSALPVSIRSQNKPSDDYDLEVLLNESHSIYVDNTKVLGYAIVDTTICITYLE